MSKKNKKKGHFRERRRIEGRLTTVTPLHLGSGQMMKHPGFKGKDEKDVEVMAVCVDSKKRAVIHGSALKGSLRSFLDRCPLGLEKKESFVRLFGAGGVGSEDCHGGVLEFHDARVIHPLSQLFSENQSPWWDEQRQTVIESHTSIDRHTGVVRENHLFYREYVPVGVVFQFVITGCFSQKDAQLVLALLQHAFSGDKSEGLSLGADVVHGCGKMAWELDKITSFGHKNLRLWLRQDDRRPIAVALTECGKDTYSRSAVKKLVKGFESAPLYSSLSIELKFDAAFLAGMIEEKRKIDGKERNVTVSKKTADEKLILPASSFRGAFRSQAEKILRTLGGGQDSFLLACDPLDRGKRSKNQGVGCWGSIEKIEQKDNLCLICQLFGASGWRSPVEVSDFTMKEKTAVTWLNHRMIAVDRFTGGAGNGALYSCEGGWRPTLKGEIRYRPELLPKGGLALLAMTLRDLLEGDIYFGYGRARGYGSCTWEAEGTRWQEESFQEEVRNDRKYLEDIVVKRLVSVKEVGENDDKIS